MDNEIIDISSFNDDFMNSKSSSSSSRSGSGSTNFGGGLELLMNDKKRESSNPASDIDIEDLNNLEDELNHLADESYGRGNVQQKSDIFTQNVRFNDSNGNGSSKDDSPHISIGESTANTDADNKTWDGYTKFNNIPLNPDKPVSSQPQMSKEELLREKFKYLRKLETLESKGVTLTKKYSMESPLAEMQGEYEMIMEEKAKQNSVKFQGNMLMACINGIEFLNNRFDPFDIKLDGWSDQVNENLNDYDELFGELYEKYKSKASMAPELKLLFQLGGSAMMVHMTNTMFKSAMPSMDDIFRQNPDLMSQFQNAAVNSMGQTNPGFAGFMGGLMNPQQQQQPEQYNNRGGPPPPLATQTREAPSSRPGNNSSTTFNMNRRPTFDDGIDIRENFSGATDAEKSRRSSRPEMKGPSDISDILSGLKTKTINIQEASSSQNDEGGSTISISELKELQSEGTMPKRSKRRQKSDKNTLSLDI